MENQHKSDEELAFDIDPFGNEDESTIKSREEHLKEKELKRQKLSETYKNCYFGSQTKAEKNQARTDKLKKNMHEKRKGQHK